MIYQNCTEICNCKEITQFSQRINSRRSKTLDVFKDDSYKVGMITALPEDEKIYLV